MEIVVENWTIAELYVGHLDATVTEYIITSHLDNFPPLTEGSYLETRRNWIPNVSRNFSLDG